MYFDNQPPSWDGFQQADPSRHEVLRVLEDDPRGQILASSAGALFELIILICRFFPGKLMIVAQNQEEMHRLKNRLSRRLKEPVICITKGLKLSESRIEVGTVGSLDLMFADVVILANGDQALHAKTRVDLGYLHRQRIYGLRLVQEPESLPTDLILEGIIGPVLYHTGPNSERPRTVSVLLADWRCRSSSYGPFGLEWKRHAIWGNLERNDAIACIARAIIAGDLLALGEHGIFPDADDESILVGGAGSVAILVESPEHAAALGSMLPGWRLVTGQSESDVERPESTGSSQDHAESLSEVRPDRMIITQVGASRYPMGTLVLVIRADGLRWPLEVPQLLKGTMDGKQGRLLMIDLRDDFDKIAVDATRRRIEDYQRRNWNVLSGQQILEIAGGE
jgi:hypothetical protein